MEPGQFFPERDYAADDDQRRRMQFFMCCYTRAGSAAYR